MTETRNVLIEAARITRGEIRPLARADAAELDALIVPGVWRGEEFKAILPLLVANAPLTVN